MKGKWLKHALAGPPSHTLLANLSEIIFWLLSHCLASFPLPAFSVHEQLSLQQFQNLDTYPEPLNPPDIYSMAGRALMV